MPDTNALAKGYERQAAAAAPATPAPPGDGGAPTEPGWFFFDAQREDGVIRVTVEVIDGALTFLVDRDDARDMELRLELAIGSGFHRTTGA